MFFQNFSSSPVSWISDSFFFEKIFMDFNFSKNKFFVSRLILFFWGRFWWIFECFWRICELLIWKYFRNSVFFHRNQIWNCCVLIALETSRQKREESEPQHKLIDGSHKSLISIIITQEITISESDFPNWIKYLPKQKYQTYTKKEFSRKTKKIPPTQDLSCVTNFHSFFIRIKGTLMHDFFLVNELPFIFLDKLRTFRNCLIQVNKLKRYSQKRKKRKITMGKVGKSGWKWKFRKKLVFLLLMWRKITFGEPEEKEICVLSNEQKILGIFSENCIWWSNFTQNFTEFT